MKLLKIPAWPAIAAATGLAVVPLALLPATPSGAALPYLIGAFVLIGVGWTIGGVLTLSVRQAYTPEHLMTRVNATYRFFAYGLATVSVLTGGLLGEVIGLRPALLVAAAGALTALTWALLSPIRGLRDMPGAEVG